MRIQALCRWGARPAPEGIFGDRESRGPNPKRDREAEIRIFCEEHYDGKSIEIRKGGHPTGVHLKLGVVVVKNLKTGERRGGLSYD